MRVEHLFRYPVKGLSPEALARAPLGAGETLPWDRAFALAQGDAPFDPAAPRFLAKRNFMCLMKNAAIAAISARFEPETGTLSLGAPQGAIEENALSAAGRERIGAWLAAFLGAEARGQPRFHFVPGHAFTDQKSKLVSLINLASLGDLEARVGAARDLRRFRANVYFSGAAPFAERDWIGNHIRLGTATLRVVKHIARCPATEVNPETAARDANPVAELRAAYGHPDLGVLAEIIAPGEVAIGAALASLEASLN